MEKNYNIKVNVNGKNIISDYSSGINITPQTETAWKSAEDGKRKYKVEQIVVGCEIDIQDIDDGSISDGYHTFDELYYHRMILFAVICNTYKDKAWKSWKHHDGTMYNDYFIVGIETEKGQYSYHYHKKHWDMFKCCEHITAPEWDGHKPSDIDRLLTLI